MKVAAAAYPLDWFESWADYETKIAAWVAEAAGEGAELLVFLEYGGSAAGRGQGRAAWLPPEIVRSAVSKATSRASMGQRWERA